MKRARYKRMDELSAWDLNKGCRHIVDQSTHGRRRLKKCLRRQSRKKINKEALDKSEIL